TDLTQWSFWRSRFHQRTSASNRTSWTCTNHWRHTSRAQNQTCFLIDLNLLLLFHRQTDLPRREEQGKPILSSHNRRERLFDLLNCCAIKEDWFGKFRLLFLRKRHSLQFPLVLSSSLLARLPDPSLL